MERVEDSTRPSQEDLSFWVKELSNKLDTDYQFNDWEKGFILSMREREIAGIGFSENMEKRLRILYKKVFGSVYGGKL